MYRKKLNFFEHLSLKAQKSMIFGSRKSGSCERVAHSHVTDFRGIFDFHCLNLMILLYGNKMRFSLNSSKPERF